MLTKCAREVCNASSPDTSQTAKKVHAWKNRICFYYYDNEMCNNQFLLYYTCYPKCVCVCVYFPLVYALPLQQHYLLTQTSR